MTTNSESAPYLYSGRSIQVGDWSHASGASVRQARSSTLLRSSSDPEFTSHHIVKSNSTSLLSKMAAAVTSPPASHEVFSPDNAAMNTIPDPRSPTPSSTISRAGSTDSSRHPDLSNEVATLSTKLINAINHQTTLDDSLQATRQELDSARERIAQLEAANREHNRLIDSGILIRRDEIDATLNDLRTQSREDRKQKVLLEERNKSMEQELESLTTALFEEANTMVAAARREREATEKKNEQLKTQLKDTQQLLASHQEQLQDLKAVMQQMSSDRDDETNTTAPSSPGAFVQDKMNRIFDSANLSPHTPGSDEFTPEHPLRFSHLIRPVMRTDLQAYDDFRTLLKTSHQASSPSRIGSGNYSSLALNLKAFSSPNNPPSHSSAHDSASTGSHNHTSNGSPTNTAAAASLKEAKFFKRALAEDIEPTLRLDIAPGVSWLARRTILNSIAAGALIVEPLPPQPRFYGPVYACALCGENRRGDMYVRRHRFCTSDAEDAQRYPLCDYCLGRVRATCDYIGFLRMVRDGHWRAETEEEMRSAWNESVRLRERMFWTRLGGGVIPAFLDPKDSPRSLNFSPRAAAVGRPSEEGRSSGEDPFRDRPRDKNSRTDGDKAVPFSSSADQRDQGAETATISSTVDMTGEAHDSAQLSSKEYRRSEPPSSYSLPAVQTPPRPQSLALKDTGAMSARPSITIPGSFD